MRSLCPVCRNGGGLILFDEFCAYAGERSCANIASIADMNLGTIDHVLGARKVRRPSRIALRSYCARRRLCVLRMHANHLAARSSFGLLLRSFAAMPSAAGSACGHVGTSCALGQDRIKGKKTKKARDARQAMMEAAAGGPDAPKKKAKHAKPKLKSVRRECPTCGQCGAACG